MLMRRVFGWVSVVFLLFAASMCDEANDTYEFYFDSNGGTVIPALVIKRTDWDQTFPIPEKAGSAFDGWFTDEALAVPFSAESFIAGEERAIHLYAKWISADVDVTVEHYREEPDGSYVLFETVTIGGALGSLSIAPTKTYDLFDPNVLHPDRIPSGTPVQGETLVLRLYYERVTFMISFFHNGGTFIPQFETKNGRPIDMPDDPVKAGYAFGGWYNDEQLTLPFNSGSMPARNTTIYAKWTPAAVNVTVEHYLEDADGVYELAEVETVAGAYFTPITRLPNMYVGYHENVSHPGRIAAGTPVVGNVPVLRFYYERNAYVFAFEENGGSEVADLAVKFGHEVDIPAAPTRVGYAFAGWYVDAMLDEPHVWGLPMGIQNVTVYAAWAPLDYQLAFDVDGGSDVTGLTLHYEDPIALPATTKVGHAFGGWYADAACVTTPVAAGDPMPAGDLILYAKWTVRLYTIYFQENGGSERADQTQEYASTVVLPEAPVLEHFVFAGWYVDEALTSPLPYETMPPYNFNLYAKWLPLMVSITFVTNGAAAIDPLVGQSGSSYALSSPELADHIFAGWFTDAELTTQHVNTGVMPDADLTLYAKWYGMTYMLHFDTMGGDYVQDFQLPAGSPLDLPTPTRTGFVFVGWYDMMLTTAYEGTVMPEDNLVLYAKWAPVS